MPKGGYSELSGIEYPNLSEGPGGDYGSPTLMSGADPRILMVDDKKLNRYLVARLLLRDGFREVTRDSAGR